MKNAVAFMMSNQHWNQSLPYIAHFTRVEHLNTPPPLYPTKPLIPLIILLHRLCRSVLRKDGAPHHLITSAMEVCRDVTTVQATSNKDN